MLFLNCSVADELRHAGRSKEQRSIYDATSAEFLDVIAPLELRNLESLQQHETPEQEAVMHHGQATQSKNEPLSGPKTGSSRAIAQPQNGQKPRTLGFPALQSEKIKRVRFDPPRSALCISPDGLLCTDCLVISVWEHGARLRVQEVQALTEFVLLFPSGPRPVTRQCKRVSVRGNLIDVEYSREPQCYAKHMGYGP